MSVTNARYQSESSSQPEATGPRISLAEQAYEKIKQRIITLGYEPGSYLNEAMISTELGLGKTPVRRAIDQLRLEGMIDVMPRKGVIVKPVSLQEILDIADVRMITESYCARLAADRASESDIVKLEAIIADGMSSTESRDIESQMALDREFHNVISVAAKNQVLAEVLRNLHERSLRFWFISLTDPVHGKRVGREHTAIVNAIKRRDGDKAEAAMKRHVESFRKNVTRQV